MRLFNEFSVESRLFCDTYWNIFNVPRAQLAVTHIFERKVLKFFIDFMICLNIVFKELDLISLLH